MKIETHNSVASTNVSANLAGGGFSQVKTGVALCAVAVMALAPMVSSPVQARGPQYQTYDTNGNPRPNSRPQVRKGLCEASGGHNPQVCKDRALKQIPVCDPKFGCGPGNIDPASYKRAPRSSY